MPLIGIGRSTSHGRGGMRAFAVGRQNAAVRRGRGVLALGDRLRLGRQHPRNLLLTRLLARLSLACVLTVAQGRTAAVCHTA